MKALKLIRNIGMSVVGVAAIAGIITFSAVHSNNTVNAHGPDPTTPPVMAGDLAPDTPVVPVAPEVMPTPAVNLTVEQQLENDMREIFNSKGFNNNSVMCEYSEGNASASMAAMLLATGESSYNGLDNTADRWTDTMSAEVSSHAEVAICAGSASKHSVSGMSFN
jgi:hypothetical protein